MQALNAPTTKIIEQNLSEEFHPLWDNRHLKIKAYKYQKIGHEPYKHSFKFFLWKAIYKFL